MEVSMPADISSVGRKCCSVNDSSLLFGFLISKDTGQLSLVKMLGFTLFSGYADYKQ
jgi:hypothetical protein